MSTQIIEKARQELMAQRIAIDNALNSLDQVEAPYGRTTAVEALEHWPENEPLPIRLTPKGKKCLAGLKKQNPKKAWRDVTKP